MYMPRSYRALRLVVLAGTCAICLGRSPGAMAGDAFRCGMDDYAIEHFPAKADTTKRKFVVLVHGTDGLREFGDQLRTFAASLAALGYLVALPNNFGKDDNAQRNGSPDEEVQRLVDSINWAAGQPDADKGHVGLIGYSLGSALALRYTEMNPLTVQMVVDNCGPTDSTDPRMSTTLGPMWKIVEDAPKLPPILILHNQKT
jgi:dienelactone hydrolase